MSDTREKETCPECGLVIPAGAGCPGCSLRLALAPDGFDSNLAPPPPPGLRSRYFGNYEILEEIARGGMGVVYRARQLGLNRLVALKMVQSSQLLSDEARLRFRVEIEAVAQLNHPHIVSLYESGDQDGIHYFTMRLVEGGDLVAHLRQARPLRERIQLMVKVCRAVHYAHQRGILHRDLKPSNILVDTEGEPHVADFGLAKSIDHDSGFTFTSSVLGSPNYMAPEQATGKVHQLTTAVDVYGLGAILYQMLSGRPPFEARTPIETLRKVADDEPAPLRSIDRTIDRDLETIALKCLRKQPGARYGTAEDVAQDLERWLAGEPIVARPLGRGEAMMRWTRRHPAAALLGAALVLALSTMAVGTTIAAMRIRNAEMKANGHLRESLLREAASLRRGSELGHREEALQLIREAAALGGSPEFRMRARNELLATVPRTEPQFIAAAGRAHATREHNLFHPTFRYAAVLENESDLYFRDVENGTTTGRISLPRRPMLGVREFDPRGRFLAMQHADDLAVYRLTDARRMLSIPGSNHTFAFHPREDAMLVQDSPNQAAWFDLRTGNERSRWSASFPRVSGSAAGWHAFALSPNGRVLAAGSPGNMRLELFDAATGRELRLLTNSSRMAAMTWASDSVTLAVATEDATVILWNTASGEVIWTSPAMIAAGHSLAFHPHRDWLAIGCGDGKVRFIDTYQQRFVFEFAGETTRVNFSPHGTRLGPVWSEGRLGWLETRRPEAFISFGAGYPWDRLTDAAFSPDATTLLVGHPTSVMVCSPNLGRRVKTLRGWRMAGAAFHPRTGELYATDTNGIWRYNQTLTGATATLQPMGILLPGPEWRSFAFTPDGRHFAAYNGQSNTVFLFDHTLTNAVATAGSHVWTEQLSVSPDARWIATGSRSDRMVRLWRVADGMELTNFPARLQPRSAFSSDGQWLAVLGDDLQLLRTETWKPAPPLPFGEERPILGAAAFSPDSRILAVVVNRFEVHLFDLPTFAPLAILRPPGTFPILALTFASDGGQLAATGLDARVAIWNMHALERNLAELQLSWRQPRQ